ncbi:MAG TPA: S41 family peptidase [Gemmatimonadaceae bacterium]|jgi:carboxyl-terminal processing protease|nr:S41 family peptidase [Gemmatimonadaceae bacterium]
MRAATFLLLVTTAAPLGAQHVAAPDSTHRDTTHRDTTHAIRQWTTYEDLKLFSQVLNALRLNHADSLDTHRLVMAAVDGMVHAADPHSFVVAAVRLNPAKEAAYRAGQLVPVPVSFLDVGGRFMVAGAAPGSAAARADILPADRLIAVDSAPVTASSVAELEVALAGPPHSTALLTLSRQRLDGSTVRLERRVPREAPGAVTAVPTAILLDRRTGYVRVTSFLSDRAADDLHAALGRLRGLGMERLILDLRDNGGGEVRQAARVAGEFLPTGSIVYTAAGRKKDLTDTGRVTRSFFRHEARYPVVVLINGGTASASELVAGALQDHDRAVIVGSPSFGKALLMVPMQLSDGSILIMVVGHTRTPSGRVIQRIYRGVRLQEYYDGAWAPRDTAGLPRYTTDDGRTVYGGGGIVPDVTLGAPTPLPLWLERAREDRVPFQWAGAYLDAHGAEYTTLDAFATAPTLPATAITDFRAFAAAHGDSADEGAPADRTLQRVLALVIAEAKWGDAGYYRIAALSDPDISAATAAFDRAPGILAGPGGTTAP